MSAFLFLTHIGLLYIFRMMRQLNNIHFDTIQGASARQSKIVSSASQSPLVSQQKDEAMILTLENNQIKKEKNWNDTALNIYTRKGNSVTIETIYRYAPSRIKTISYDDFKAWRKEIINSEQDFKNHCINVGGK